MSLDVLNKQQSVVHEDWPGTVGAEGKRRGMGESAHGWSGDSTRDPTSFCFLLMVKVGPRGQEDPVGGNGGWGGWAIGILDEMLFWAVMSRALDREEVALLCRRTILHIYPSIPSMTALRESAIRLVGVNVPAPS